MKRIWSYIAMAFAGFSAGLIAMYKLMGDKIEVNIKKVKNKRVGSASTNIPINIAQPTREQKKAIRQSKREQRRSK